jgi:hypothetical protein
MVAKVNRPVEKLPPGDPVTRAQNALNALDALTTDFRGLLLESELLPEHYSAALLAYGWAFLSQALIGEAQIPNARDCLTAMRNKHDSLRTFRMMAAVWAMKGAGTLPRIGILAPRAAFLGSFLGFQPAFDERLNKHVPGWQKLEVSFGKAKLRLRN